LDLSYSHFHHKSLGEEVVLVVQPLLMTADLELLGMLQFAHTIIRRLQQLAAAAEAVEAKVEFLSMVAVAAAAWRTAAAAAAVEALVIPAMQVVQARGSIPAQVEQEMAEEAKGV
jgi:hypothetical protein